jgi:predicted signal transduction protein with EAL and GGDEF domain
VVAEGVETTEQERQLQDYGCDLVQGYLYSRPQPETELLRYLLGHSSSRQDRRVEVAPRSGGDVGQQGELPVGQGELRAGQ